MQNNDDTRSLRDIVLDGAGVALREGRRARRVASAVGRANWNLARSGLRALDRATEWETRREVDDHYRPLLRDARASADAALAEWRDMRATEVANAAEAAEIKKRMRAEIDAISQRRADPRTTAIRRTPLPPRPHHVADRRTGELYEQVIAEVARGTGAQFDDLYRQSGTGGAGGRRETADAYARRQDAILRFAHDMAQTDPYLADLLADLDDAETDSLHARLAY